MSEDCQNDSENIVIMEKMILSPIVSTSPNVGWKYWCPRMWDCLYTAVVISKIWWHFLQHGSIWLIFPKHDNILICEALAHGANGVVRSVVNHTILLFYSVMLFGRPPQGLTLLLLTVSGCTNDHHRGQCSSWNAPPSRRKRCLDF